MEAEEDTSFWIVNWFWINRGFKFCNYILKSSVLWKDISVVKESLIYTVSNVSKLFSIIINKKADHSDFFIS